VLQLAIYASLLGGKETLGVKDALRTYRVVISENGGGQENRR